MGFNIATMFQRHKDAQGLDAGSVIAVDPNQKKNILIGVLSFLGGNLSGYSVAKIDSNMEKHGGKVIDLSSDFKLAGFRMAIAEARKGRK